jgi:hypothetical protein
MKPKSLSPQRRYQIRQTALGRCRDCGRKTKHFRCALCNAKRVIRYHRKKSRVTS